jgi:hypothetical protein
MPNKLPFLPDEHHYAIAHVATRAAQLDHQIEFSVDAQMRSYRKAAEYIIKGSDTNRLVGLLDALLRDNFPSRISEIDALMQDIKAARQERNEILHWLWSKGEDDATAKLGSLRIHRDPNIKTKTAEEVYALADRLLRAVLSLHHFDDMVQGGAWPDKPAQPTRPQHSASPETQNPQEGGGLLGPLPPPSPERSEQ